ncbi:MAG: efflux RND transporter permease subunit [Paludibacteraceae bacterium]|nr:efflux RND transporter permease subunit [Paludibacteraceae bacterium]
MQLKTFIKKPVLSSVISILIVILGLIGLLSLPVEQYPDIAPPTVYVSTFYTGASASTIQKSVIVPLEEAINGVEDMIYMSSKASNSGEVEIQIYFKQGTNPDMATVNVQNRVSQAEAQLPAEVKQYGVSVTKQQNSILQFIAISSPDDRYDEKFLNNYLNINLKPKVMRINGVGKMSMFGSDYSMRIWLKPDVMAAHHITPTDVLAALSEQNIEAATGTIGDNSEEQTQYAMVYSGRLQTIEEFERIIVHTTENGETLYLSEIANIELGNEFYSFQTQINCHPGAMCAVYQTAGSNAREVNNAITQLIEDEKKTMPEGLQFDVLMNTNDFLNASMHEVVKTLLEALALVVLIVLLFLHDWQSTVIPFVGIFVSLIGTFAFMQAVGFSMNLISLFALVLVIGTVVDDSIVVVEAVHEKLDAGYKSSMKASIDAMSEITMAVITSSLVFMAVFIPVSMMSGTSGTFFRQFGLTMAVAVGISAVNALTLSPALCALMIRPKDTNKKKNLYNRFSDAFDTAFGRWSEKYKNGLKPMVKHPWTAFAVVAASVVVMFWVMKTTPQGFVPQEDKGMFLCEVMMPAGTSLHVTSQLMSEMESDIMKIGDVKTVSKVAGYGFMSGRSNSAGFFVVSLKPWEERKFYSIANVMQQVAQLGDVYKDAMVVPFQMPMIPGYGSSADAEVYLQDKTGGSIDDLMSQMNEFLAALNQHPDVQSAYSTFNNENPQYMVKVDINRCHQAGLQATDVLNSLAIFMGGYYCGDVNLYGKVYKVMVQGTADSHKTIQDLNTNYIRTKSGEMAPLSNFLQLRPIKGAALLTRFNMLNSIQFNASPAQGKSTGELISAIRETAEKVLSRDYTYDYGGMTREQSSNSGMGMMFAISALLIYLILACLYESYIVPLSILLAVPLGLMGAFLFTKLFGMDNNIYLQTGVVMLIGLLSKTGILIVEFALQKRKVDGLSIVDSALEAAKARLRPIMMTAGTMVIGLLPLLTSRGVGAMGNISLGIGTVFGMLIGCVGLLFLIPALFVVFQTLQEKIKPLDKEKEEEMY